MALAVTVSAYVDNTRLLAADEFDYVLVPRCTSADDSDRFAIPGAADPKLNGT